MSGRVMVDLPDGRRVRGFRKTLRRNARAPGGAPQEHRLVFQLPREIWAVPEGAHGSQVDVGRMRNVTVKGFDRDYVLEQAARFLQQHADGHPYLSTSGVMQTARGSDTVQIVLVRGNVVVFYGAAKHWIFLGRK